MYALIPNMGFRIKTTIIFSCIIFSLKAQQDSLLKQKNTNVYNKYTLFGFYDFVRLAGVGVEYRSDPAFSIDLRVGAIYSGGPILKTNDNPILFSRDYSFNKGVGFMLSPKYYIGKKRVFYLGLSAALYDYGYKNRFISTDETQNYLLLGTYNTSGAFVVSGLAPITQTITTKETKSTASFAFNYTIGFSKCIGRINYEFFIAAGAERTYSKIITEQTITPFLTWPNSNVVYTPTNSYKEKSVLFTALVGFEVGIGFKQQYFINYTYYIKLLNRMLKEDDKYMILIKEYDDTLKEEKEEYYKYRRKQFEELKRAYKTTENDTAFMQKETNRACQRIKEYINDNFKSIIQN